MKTPEQVTKLNFNDIAFFKGITTSDAKWLMSEHIFKIDNIEEYLTKSGVPKISAKEFLDKKRATFQSLFCFTICRITIFKLWQCFI